MKIYIPIAVILVLSFLTSCNQDKINELEQQLVETQNKLEETESMLEEAESKISDINDSIKEMESAVNDLRSEVNDFEDENWSYNVPDVENASSGVEMALENLKSTAN